MASTHLSSQTKPRTSLLLDGRQTREGSGIVWSLALSEVGFPVRSQETRKNTGPSGLDELLSPPRGGGAGGSGPGEGGSVADDEGPVLGQGGGLAP